MWLLFLGACSFGIAQPRVGDSPIVEEEPLDTAVEDTAPVDTDPEIIEAEPEPVVTEEAAPAFDDSDLAGWLFELDRIHEIALEIPDTSVAALTAEPYVWASADVTIDGEPMNEVGVRLRGKIGSFRALTAKPKFKISFNEFREDARFYGLEELSLNNEVVDCSYMKEVIGYRLYEMMGVPSLRTAYAHVTVNGADYGLYVMVETPNDRWLARHYEDPSGNLYDGKYVWYGGWNYTLLDFGNGVDALYQLEEGTDVANADIAAVSTALLATQDTADLYTGVGAVVDWDNFHRLTVVDQFIGHADGYSMNTNNYRVYFDPTDGKADLLPWDLDYAFIYDYQWGLSWGAPQGNLTAACWRNPDCVTAHKATVSDFLDRWAARDATGFLDAIEALTYEATQTDPRRECAAADVQPTRDYVRAWLAAGPDAMRTWWGL